jgi:hypothetical protein
MVARSDDAPPLELVLPAKTRTYIHRAQCAACSSALFTAATRVQAGTRGEDSALKAEATKRGWKYYVSVSGCLVFLCGCDKVQPINAA